MFAFVVATSFSSHPFARRFIHSSFSVPSFLGSDFALTELTEGKKVTSFAFVLGCMSNSKHVFFGNLDRVKLL